MKTILMALAILLLLTPIMAEEKRPEFRFMKASDIATQYEIAIAQSMMEDAEDMRLLTLLSLSQDIPCIDVIISTEPIQHWDSYSAPTWFLGATNCVDKRTYQCEEE